MAPSASRRSEYCLQTGAFPAKLCVNIAKLLYNGILAYFESEEGKEEFAEWKKQKEQEKANTETENSEA